MSEVPMHHPRHQIYNEPVANRTNQVEFSVGLCILDIFKVRQTSRESWEASLPH